MRKTIRVVAILLLLYAAVNIFFRDMISLLSMQRGRESVAIFEWFLPDVVALASFGYILYTWVRKYNRRDV